MNHKAEHTIMRHFSILAMGLMLLVFASCRKEDRDNHSFVFWSSTNTEEVAFSKKHVDQWNLEHPGTPFTFQPVPEGQSSEEVILAAVVGRTTPDIYANMWQGDVEDFARSGVLIPLDTLDGFMDFLYARCDSQVVKEVTSMDGHIYQMPWKVNPIMMMYNPALFTKAGMDSIPQHYSDLISAGAKLKTGGFWLGISESNAIWWQRFFNFLPLYYAASGGAPLIQNHKAVFDNEYGIEVFSFLQKLYANGYFPKEQLKGQRDPFLAERVAITFTGPWTIEHNNEFKPAGMTFDFQEVPVPDDHNGPIYTYGDPKNMVMFNTCTDPELAWKFVQTMLTPEADKEFLQASRQFPRRKDLQENPIFVQYFNAHPELIPFARQAQHVRGMDSAPYMKEVLDLISQEYEACVVFGLKSPEDAIHDAAHAVDLLYIE
jgi:multiple sugar transport system substrate-binding protein